jgi:hypothetical protein
MHFTDWAVMAVFLQQILPDSVWTSDLNMDVGIIVN